MGDHEYVLALEPDIDDLHFDSDSSESALPSPRLLDESLTISSDWQVDVRDLLSEQTAADKKGPKEGTNNGQQEEEVGKEELGTRLSWRWRRAMIPVSTQQQPKSRREIERGWDSHNSGH
jgi:hypothetical protein